MIKRLLVGVDGSSHSYKAVTFAAELSAQCGASLRLMTAVADRSVPEELRRFADVEHAGTSDVEVNRLIGERLLDHAREHAVAGGAPEIETVVAVGEPVGAILAAARDAKPDAIVLGTRGLSDLEGVLIGSVSHKLSMLAPCPVITVR